MPRERIVPAAGCAGVPFHVCRINVRQCLLPILNEDLWWDCPGRKDLAAPHLRLHQVDVFEPHRLGFRHGRLRRFHQKRHRHARQCLWKDERDQDHRQQDGSVEGACRDHPIVAPVGRQEVFEAQPPSRSTQPLCVEQCLKDRRSSQSEPLCWYRHRVPAKSSRFEQKIIQCVKLREIHGNFRPSWNETASFVLPRAHRRAGNSNVQVSAEYTTNEIGFGWANAVYLKMN